jgi:hypothetical protein
VLSASDCDDDGQGTEDRGHCAAAVSELNQPGDIGHDIFLGYQVLAGASIGADAMRGSVQTTGAGLFAFLYMSMVDTYTLSSSTLPPGTAVPITVSFRAVGSMIPEGIFFPSGPLAGYGGGSFQIKIGNAFSTEPFMIPESGRINSPFEPTASASFFLSNAPSAAPIPLDLTATHTFDATIGAPFDLAFQLQATPKAATIDFSNTAMIGFAVPEGTVITSTGGFGNPTPVQETSWGRVKALYR